MYIYIHYIQADLGQPTFHSPRKARDLLGFPDSTAFATKWYLYMARTWKRTVVGDGLPCLCLVMI